MLSKVGRLHTFLEVFIRQISLSQVAYIPGKSARDDILVQFDAGVQERQHLEDILPGARRCVDDHSSFFQSPHGIF